MLLSRIATRSSRVGLARCRDSLLALAHRKQPEAAPALFNLYHSFVDTRNQVINVGEPQLRRMPTRRFPFQHSNMFSSTSHQPNEKDAVQSESEPGTESKSDAAGMRKEAPEQSVASEEAKIPDEKDTADSDSDTTSELSRDDLIKLVRETKEQLKNKQEEQQKMQDKALRTYAEMQNSMARTKREAENLKKFAVQDFAKNLLDVADNLGRACSVVKKDFAKMEDNKDDAGLQLLKTLLQGVEMTEKQLAEVFKKYGVEKYDPLNEEFDPHRHNAVFQVPDPSKPPGTVAHVLKAGYKLHDRIIRPAEVGVTQAVEEKDAGESSAT